jgi:peptidoglycan hydrolase FlgJ
MPINMPTLSTPPALTVQTPQPKPPSAADGDSNKLRKAFDDFVGETFFGQMLSSMRKSVGKPAYFYGGRAEEIFQGQLDQTLSQQMTKASASQFTGPMFELFKLNRS